MSPLSILLIFFFYLEGVAARSNLLKVIEFDLNRSIVILMRLIPAG